MKYFIKSSMPNNFDMVKYVGVCGGGDRIYVSEFGIKSQKRNVVQPKDSRKQ